jgi:hypothetical protein
MRALDRARPQVPMTQIERRMVSPFASLLHTADGAISSCAMRISQEKNAQTGAWSTLQFLPWRLVAGAAILLAPTILSHWEEHAEDVRPQGRRDKAGHGGHVRAWVRRCTTASKIYRSPLLPVAEAVMKIDEAEFHARRLAAMVDAMGADNASWSIEERVSARGDLGAVRRLAKEAVDILHALMHPARRPWLRRCTSRRYCLGNVRNVCQSGRNHFGDTRAGASSSRIREHPSCRRPILEGSACRKTKNRAR